MGPEFHANADTLSLCLADFMHVSKDFNYLRHYHYLFHYLFKNIWNLDKPFFHCAYANRDLFDSIDYL
jgi:hypothetical protein